MTEPKEKRTVRIPILVTQTTADAIDQWRIRQPGIPPRSEALRFLALSKLVEGVAYDPSVDLESDLSGSSG